MFFNDTATTEIYTLSLHGALPIWPGDGGALQGTPLPRRPRPIRLVQRFPHAFRGTDRESQELAAIARAISHMPPAAETTRDREEHTSELQSRQYLVCRLLLEKIKS